MNIEWKDIKGFEGIYQASNTGEIKRVLSQRILKHSIIPQGYHYVKLSKKSMLVHRLIYEAFYGPIPSNLYIDHIDNDQSNNYLSNFQLISHRKNTSKDRSSKSGFTGVFEIKPYSNGKNRYIANAYKNDKRKHLGTFKCKIEASQIYNNYVHLP